MLEKAKSRLVGLSVELIECDFLTYDGLKPHSFDALVASLVLEHIEDLNRFFMRVSELLRDGGELYLSEIHPSRTAAGTFAHFKSPDTRTDIHLTSYAHTEFGIVTAARASKLLPLASRDFHGDEALAELNPKWGKYMGLPMLKIFSFVKRE